VGEKSLAKRRCQTVLAAVGSPSNQEINFAFKGAYSGIVGDGFDNNASNSQDMVAMSTKALGEIFNELNVPHEIDYFSLDVEGAESLVMDGFPWNKYEFNVMTVERPKGDLYRALVSHGYHFIAELGWFGETLWIHESIPNFKHIMDNTISQFEVPTDSQLMELCQVPAA